MIGTLLFGGVDLASVVDIQDLSDFWSSADLRGDLPTYPGVNGAVAVNRPFSSQVCTGQVVVVGDTPTAAEAKVAALKALVRQGVAQTLTRRRFTAAGFLDATQTAITRGVAERWVTATLCQPFITVEMLDGVWHGASTAIASVAGAQTIAGDYATSKILLTLAAGATRTVTNTTNGYAFTFSTTVPTGGVLIDVEARTATAITGGADMSRYLSWTKAAPMQLEAGSNTLTVSAVSASLTYQPAYL